MLLLAPFESDAPKELVHSSQVALGGAGLGHHFCDFARFCPSNRFLAAVLSRMDTASRARNHHGRELFCFAA